MSEGKGMLHAVAAGQVFWSSDTLRLESVLKLLQKSGETQAVVSST